MSTPSETSQGLRHIISRARHLLLDFDGPVCDVYAGTSSQAVADEMRAQLEDLSLPAHVLSDDDPLEILKAAATLGPEAAARAQDVFVRLEVRAVSTARPTAGATDVMATARASGRSVAIVSNNSGAAVSTYLAAHDLAPYVHVVLGRDDPAPWKMKPDPYRVSQAIKALRARIPECVLIGDSPSDIIAAHAAGISAIGHANKPGKADLLHLAGADAVTDSMIAIAHAARTSDNLVSGCRDKRPHQSEDAISERPDRDSSNEEEEKS